jgi:hypothetical protein
VSGFVATSPSEIIESALGKQASRRLLSREREWSLRSLLFHAVSNCTKSRSRARNTCQFERSRVVYMARQRRRKVFAFSSGKQAARETILKQRTRGRTQKLSN